MPFHTDTRAVSVAVNHVMAIGITTVLVVGLLAGAGTMLENEREASAEGSLEIVGERLAEEISSVDRYAADGDETDLTVRTDHNRRVSGTTYTVDVSDDVDECGPVINEPPCLVLSATDEDAEVYVPIQNESPVTTEDDDPVSSGSIVIRYDSSDPSINGIELQEGDS